MWVDATSRFGVPSKVDDQAILRANTEGVRRIPGQSY